MATTLLCVLSPPFQGASAGDAGKNDHLAVVDQNEAKSYRREFASKLFVTPADCARMSVRPAWAPEFAVSVYSQLPAHQKSRKYFVTVTEASASIWYSMAENNDSNTQRIVQVNRCDAEIPAFAALALKKIWREILLDVDIGSGSSDPPVDGAIVEFALVERDRQLFGELPTDPGKRTAALEQLGNLLIKYCRGSSYDRQKLAKSIADDATSLQKK